MKTLKKPVALIAVIAILLASMLVSLSGCSKESGAQNTSSSQNTTTQAKSGGEDITESEGAVPESEGGKISDEFTIWVGWNKNSPDETTWQKVMREKLNINIKCEYVQGDDALTAVNLKLNSGGFEDLAVFWMDQTIKKAMINSGKIQPVEQYYQMPDKLPNLASVPEAIKKYATDSDGHMWYAPGWYAQEPDNPWPGWTVDAWWVRTDILEQVGMTKDDISTIEGVEEFLRKASELKDVDGNKIIPLGFMAEEEKLIVATFGVDMTSGVSGMPGIKKDGDNFIFAYDDPQYKEAYKWINKMYREKLIDIEVTTHKAERYKEKVARGSYAMIVGSAWSAELNNLWYGLDGPTEPAWYLEPVATPKVSNVENHGAVTYVNPYPGSTIYISKNTKHLNAILNFLDWCNEQKPEKQHEVNEGPVGTTWDWVNKPYGEWDFEPDYKADRDSGDQARVDKCTPQLYAFSGYSNKWYPWWTQYQGSNKKGASLLYDYCQLIGNELVNHRIMHTYDAVPLAPGGVIEANLLMLSKTVEEYTAKMIMAKSDDDFEKAYNDFREQIEKRAHWSEMKKEWMEEYNKYVELQGEW